jgi:hypothetical protein
MKFRLGAMTVGDILDRGLKLLFSRFWAYVFIQVAALFPVLLLEIAAVVTLQTSVSQPRPEVAVTYLGFVFGVLVAAMILQPLATGAALKVIAEEYVGRHISAGAAFGFTLSRFRPLIIASILTGLVILFGLFLLIIPGIIWAISYSFVAQSVVLENLGASDSMDRSAALAYGHRWRIFGLSILIFIVWLILEIGVAILGLMFPSDSPTTGFNMTSALIHVFADFAVGVIVASYGAICMTLMYFDLRVRKEGFDLEIAVQSGTSPAETR